MRLFMISTFDEAIEDQKFIDILKRLDHSANFYVATLDMTTGQKKAFRLCLAQVYLEAIKD